MLTLHAASLTTPPLVERLSDSVASGDFLAILGPNGAGKSTLLGLLSGFRKPAQGSVTLDQRPLDDWHPHDLAQRRALVAQQESPVFAWRVDQLAALGAQCDEDEVARWLERLELSDLAQRNVQTLSGGERQRVMIARALCQLAGPSQGTRYLLLDEPTSALDIGQSQALMRCLERLTQQQDLAVICVLHDLNLANAYADRVWLMDRGTRIAGGAPSEVLRADALSELYHAELDELDHSGGHWLALKH